MILCFGVGAFIGAPWVPVFRQDLDELMNLGQVRHGVKFVDLGCGDGTVLIAAARRGADVVGYEINPILWLIAWLRLLPYRSHAKVYLRSYWSVSLAKYDVVFLYLIKHYMPRMQRKLSQEFGEISRPRIVSYMFAFPGVKASKTTHNAYLYRPSDIRYNRIDS